jgi:hypothetical protein
MEQKLSSGIGLSEG